MQCSATHNQEATDFNSSEKGRPLLLQIKHNLLTGVVMNVIAPGRVVMKCAW